MKEIKIDFINKEELRGETLKVVNIAMEMMEQDDIETIHITVFYDYLKKAEDKLWKNKNRNYYIHNIPLESFSQDTQVIENILSSKENLVDESVMQNENLTLCFKMLRKCTKKQRRRYLFHHYYGMSISEIARLEGVSNFAINCSIERVNEKINIVLRK